MSTKQKIRMPQAAEESAINAGIKADPDSPEWTKADFARAESAAHVLPRLVGKQAAAEMLKPKRGRPVSAARKAHVNIRLDAEIVEQFRATGRGWQTRLNAALKEWLDA
ncbi:MAG: BrnA antitoxin family protein, partial [Betaproteobacteria bacterium]|nr:BrnA antitoxin family protein [Betaproteobacteria bacterium]